MLTKIPNHKLNEIKIFKSIINKDSVGNTLVVGCGEKGYECAAIAEIFSDKVLGIDVNLNEEAAFKHPRISLLKGNATALDFENESFDIVYCYHVLEHIENYNKALSEIKRVLKQEGILYLGVPNKSRIFGYINSQNANFLKKLQWNMKDWIARMKGEFENNKGAHAGFKRDELNNILEKQFPFVKEVSLDYFYQKYPVKKQFVSLINKSGFSKILFPSIYFIAKKS